MSARIVSDWQRAKGKSLDTETLNRFSAMVGGFEWRGTDTLDNYFFRAPALILARSALPATSTSVCDCRISHGT
jgi:hypothetical protein